MGKYLRHPDELEQEVLEDQAYGSLPIEADTRELTAQRARELVDDLVESLLGEFEGYPGLPIRLIDLFNHPECLAYVTNRVPGTMANLAYQLAYAEYWLRRRRFPEADLLASLVTSEMRQEIARECERSLALGE